MDALTVQRNGKRPRGNTKTGDKRGNEKPRQKNWLTRNAYRWHNPHYLVHCCGSHGKRMNGGKYYKMLLFWTLKCIKTVYFFAELGSFKWNPFWSERLHICPDLEPHFFPSACVCVCVWGFSRTLLCLHRTAHRLHTKHVAKCSLCVVPLCVHLESSWVWTVCLAAHADCNLACHI